MILPKNEIKEFVKMPKMFLIWGQSMSGKTYLARQFPNILILNTDGNGAKIPEPTLEIKNFETFIEAIEEIEKGNHTFETIAIDLIDDIATMMEDYICRKNSNPAKNVVYTSLAEIPYGKGFAERKAIWKALMMRLSQLQYNVIGISHVIETMDGETKIQQPSLEQVYLNMFKGRCDAYIKCSKIGTTYIQSCEERRDTYVLADIKDTKVGQALKDVRKLFDDVNNTPMVKPTNMVKKEVKVEQDANTEENASSEEPASTDAPKEVEVEKVEKPALKPMMKKKEEK